MADGEKSKLKLLYTYEILKKYSDEEHLLTANAICEKLSELYGIVTGHSGTAGRSVINNSNITDCRKRVQSTTRKT